MEQAQATSNNCAAEKSCLPPAAEPVVSEAVGTTSKAHLFIFDSEPQEDDSQSVSGDRPAAPSEPQPTVNKDAALSLTQDLLEEDKLRIRDLMNQTDKVRCCFSSPLYSFNLYFAYSDIKGLTVELAAFSVLSYFYPLLFFL